MGRLSAGMLVLPLASTHYLYYFTWTAAGAEQNETLCSSKICDDSDSGEGYRVS